MSIEGSYNFRKISDKLSTSGIVGADRLKSLAVRGYEVLVNLLPDTNDNAVPGERDIVESQGLEYIYIPVDFKQPKRSDFVTFSKVLDQSREKKLHVHCAANYRVSAFYSLYATKRGLWSTEQAMEFIHGLWQPSDHSGWSEFIADILSGDPGVQQSGPPDASASRPRS